MIYTPEILAALTAGKHESISNPWEDIAMCKAKMPWYVSEYAIAKYQSTPDTIVESARAVWSNLFLEAMTWRYTDSWPKSMCYRMCKLAVAVDLSTNICLTCDGRGSAKIGDKVVTCIHCNGTGRVRYSLRKMADFVEVDRETFRSVWHVRLQVLLRRLEQWDSQVFDKCREVTGMAVS